MKICPNLRDQKRRRMDREEINIFVSKKNGSLSSIEIPKLLIKLIIVIFITYGIILVLLLYFCVDMNRKIRIVELKNAQLVSKLERLKKIIESKSLNSEVEKEENDYLERPSLESLELETVDKHFVEIKDIRKSVEKGSVSLDFWIYSKEKGKKVSGYLFTAIVNENNMAYFYPLGSNFLAKGFELYKDGIFFSIYYRKKIKVKIDSFEGNPKKFIVCIFNSEGEKIFQRIFDL